MDELTVECEPASDGVDRETLAARLEHLLREHTGIRIAVAVVDPGRGAAQRGQGGPRGGSAGLDSRSMNWKLELVQVPVSDVDRRSPSTPSRPASTSTRPPVSDELRFVQLTPPVGLLDRDGPAHRDGAGSLQGLQLVVPTSRPPIGAVGRGVEVGEIQDLPWGSFVFFKDPDGNGWAVQQIQPRNA